MLIRKRKNPSDSISIAAMAKRQGKHRELNIFGTATTDEAKSKLYVKAHNWLQANGKQLPIELDDECGDASCLDGRGCGEEMRKVFLDKTKYMPSRLKANDTDEQGPGTIDAKQRVFTALVQCSRKGRRDKHRTTRSPLPFALSEQYHNPTFNTYKELTPNFPKKIFKFTKCEPAHIDPYNNKTYQRTNKQEIIFYSTLHVRDVPLLRKDISRHLFASAFTELILPHRYGRRPTLLE